MMIDMQLTDIQARLVLGALKQVELAGDRTAVARLLKEIEQLESLIGQALRESQDQGAEKNDMIHGD